MRLLLLIPLLLSLSACTSTAAMDNVFIFFPERTLVATPADAGLPYEDVFFPAADGTRLHGWFLPGEKGRPIVLFFHGNAGNISHRIGNLVLFRERLGVSVFIPDYRGYGLSEGEVTEEGTYRDARGARQWLEGRGWKAQEIIYFGRSLGAGVATQLAIEAPPAALVLESPFPSIAAMGRRHYSILYPLLGWAVHSRYDTRQKIDRVRVPLLIFQGEKDALVPPDMARELFDAAHGPKTFRLIPGAGHNDTVLRGGESYWEGWRTFLGTVGAGGEDG